MTRDRFERQRRYTEFVAAAIKTNQAWQAFENMKDFYDKGFVDEDRVRAAEEAYLKAKAEQDRLSNLVMGDPPPDPNARWEPPNRTWAGAV